MEDYEKIFIGIAIAVGVMMLFFLGFALGVEKKNAEATMMGFMRSENGNYKWNIELLRKESK